LFIFSVQFLKKLFAELDGDQDLELYWIDPVDAMDRLVARPEFQGKIYLQYERQESEQRPTKRAFGRANSGLVFQEAQALDLNSVPMLHLFYADKSFSGAQRRAWREISCLQYIICIFYIIFIIVIIM